MKHELYGKGAGRTKLANMYDFGQDRYYDLLREAEEYRREQHAVIHPVAKANKSPLAGLRNLTRTLLMTLTHS